MLRSNMLNGFQQIPVAGASEPAAIVCDAASFDGSSDFLTRGAGLTGAVDNKKCTFSAWVNAAAWSSSAYYFAGAGVVGGGGGTTSRLIGIAGNKVRFFLTNAASSIVICQMDSEVLPTAGAWTHIAISVDMSDTAKRHCYVNGVAKSPTWTTYTDDTADWTRADWSIGAQASGSGKLNAGVAELILHNDYIDLSVTANLRKLITSGGKPADVGADGSGVFGVAPLVYLHLDDGETANNFALNAGSGGNFTVTGALSTFASSPSD